MTTEATEPQIIETALPSVNQAFADGLEFSLCCFYCDAGMGIDSPLQATAEGWVKLQVDKHGHSHNYCGICPSCAEIYE